MNPGFLPEAATEAHFNAANNTWTLSRYADVYAALRDPRLRQVSDAGEFLLTDDTQRHAESYEAIQADMARMSLGEWRERMEAIATKLLAEAMTMHQTDLVRDVIKPWSREMLLQVGGIRPREAKRLIKLADRVFYSLDQRKQAGRVTQFKNRVRGSLRRRAQVELQRIWKEENPRFGMSMLTGLTHTLPGFLAASWLALLRNPDQAALLLADPTLVPGAVEELLRYAGIIHSLPRRASTDVSINEVVIREGQHVWLKLDSANYDPLRYDKPYNLDLRRKSPGHVGLGTGPHVCVGMLMVRLATSTLTPLLFAARPELSSNAAIPWSRDRTLHWPKSIPVRFGK